MSSGNKDLVEVLLKAGANPRKEDEENGRIPLHYSVLNGWALTAEFILSRDPDPISLANYADDYGSVSSSFPFLPLRHETGKEKKKNILTMLCLCQLFENK